VQLTAQKTDGAGIINKFKRLLLSINLKEKNTPKEGKSLFFLKMSIPPGWRACL
jgi:hypothetical protein